MTNKTTILAEFDEKFVIPEGYFNLASDPEGYNTPKDIWGKYRGGDDIKDYISTSIDSLLKSVEERCDELVKELPKTKCINAENHLFGSCFQCEKIKGNNQCASDLKTSLKSLYE